MIISHSLSMALEKLFVVLMLISSSIKKNGDDEMSGGMKHS